MSQVKVCQVAKTPTGQVAATCRLKNRSWASFRFSFLSGYVNDNNDDDDDDDDDGRTDGKRLLATGSSNDTTVCPAVATGNRQLAIGKHPADRDNSHWPVATWC
ncbi:hypothetical protein ACLKA6_006000 [Drosophila palustris]